MNASEISGALGGAGRSGEWHRCRCPVHQSKGATLALKDGAHGLIAHCHAGCSPDEVLAELNRLGPVGGAAIRLAAAREDVPLIVGEGIETTASAMLVMGWPGWAALSAGGIEALHLPPLPIAATVFIAADHDPNGTGERAARIAAERWLAEGRKVRIGLPPMPGTDWNDVLLGKDGHDIGEAHHAA